MTRVHGFVQCRAQGGAGREGSGVLPRRRRCVARGRRRSLGIRSALRERSASKRGCECESQCKFFHRSLRSPEENVCTVLSGVQGLSVQVPCQSSDRRARCVNKQLSICYEHVWADDVNGLRRENIPGPRKGCSLGWTIRRPSLRGKNIGDAGGASPERFATTSSDLRPAAPGGKTKE